MEQRNGRVDRHGQKQSEVVIWHPVDASGGHGDDILRALKKLDSMRADMGSVNPVIAPQLPALLEGRRRELDTGLAEKRIERARRYVKAERELRERIAKLHERLTTTRSEQHLTPDRIERVVRVALALTDKPDLTPAKLADLPEARVFQMPALAGSWSRCLDGLEHPYTKRIRPITFDHDAAKGRDDVVLVHLNHPLVQMSLRLLRAEVWARDDVKKLNRVTVRTARREARRARRSRRLAPRHHRRQPPSPARGADGSRRLPARRRLQARGRHHQTARLARLVGAGDHRRLALRCPAHAVHEAHRGGPECRHHALEGPPQGSRVHDRSPQAQ
jgi:hypothetical protein